MSQKIHCCTFVNHNKLDLVFIMDNISNFPAGENLWEKMSDVEIHVAITGASRCMAPNLIYLIVQGDVFGKNQPVSLHLVDVPDQLKAMEGCAMEMVGAGFPLLRDCSVTSKLDKAFKDIDVAFLLPYPALTPQQSRVERLEERIALAKLHGEALNMYAKPTVKVVMVGHCANTRILVCSKFAPSIPTKNFTAVSHHIQNFATSLLSLKLRSQLQGLGGCLPGGNRTFSVTKRTNPILHTSDSYGRTKKLLTKNTTFLFLQKGTKPQSVRTDDIKDIIVWGNTSETVYADLRHATVKMPHHDKEINAYAAVKNDYWIKGEYTSTVQELMYDTTENMRSIATAVATAEHMKEWWCGTELNHLTSMVVMSDGSYKIPQGLFFSFPVTVTNNEWKILKGLHINGFDQMKINENVEQLKQEYNEAMKLCKQYWQFPEKNP